MNDISKLRLYLNDKEGKLFTDEELQMFLAESDCIYCAAAEGWTLIATRVNLTDTTKYSVGIETYEKSGVDKQIKAALNNASYFKSKCNATIDKGSFILKSSTRFDL